MRNEKNEGKTKKAKFMTKKIFFFSSSLHFHSLILSFFSSPTPSRKKNLRFEMDPFADLGIDMDAVVAAAAAARAGNSQVGKLRDGRMHSRCFLFFDTARRFLFFF